MSRSEPTLPRRAIVLVGLKPERRSAFLAGLVVVPTLKDRALRFLVALRTYEVSGLTAALVLSERVDKVPAGRLMKVIRRKLVLRILRTSDFILEQSKLRLQQEIAEARVLHCQRQLVHGGFNLCIASALRRLQKRLDAPNGLDRPLNGGGYGPGALGNAVDRLEAKLHHLLHARREVAIGWGLANGMASTGPIPSNGTAASQKPIQTGPAYVGNLRGDLWKADSPDEPLQQIRFAGKDTGRAG